MKWILPNREAQLIGVNRLMLAFLSLPAVALLGWMLLNEGNRTRWTAVALALFTLASGALWFVKRECLVRGTSLVANILVIAAAVSSIRRDLSESGVQLMTALEVLLIGAFFFVPLCILGRDLFARKLAGR
jgi:hypothetical protein